MSRMKCISCLGLLLLALFLSGCCEEPGPSFNRIQVDANLVTENRKGYFRLTHLQVTPPSIAGGQWQPLTLAVTDWNNDGVPDLLSSYETQNGGFVVLQTGNFAFNHPEKAGEVAKTDAWSDSPFLAAAQVMELPLHPDFLFAGDFNDDGFQDILIAQKNSSYLFWSAGNAQGEFRNASPIPLPGTITVLHVGELDRPIGVPYVMVGLQSNNGSELHIYRCDHKNPFTEPESYEFSEPFSD